MPTTLVVDVDSHITEPPDLWTSRVAHKYVDQVPHVHRTDDGRDIWLLNDKQVGVVGMTAVAGWPEPFPAGPPTYDEVHPASYDADARLRYLDEAGIWAQVIYPNVAGFGSQRFIGLGDEELKLACVRAYNDFQRDWAAADPRRIITVIATPFWDIEQMVAEIERGAEAGHKGILFTGEPQRFGLPFIGDRHWDPLWSVASETGLPIHFHIGSGDMTTSFQPDRIAAVGTAAAYAYTSVELFLKNGLQVSDLITSGVLPRFPDTRFVSVESGIGWIPFVLEAADHSYLEGRPDRTSEWELLPSEYFKRQVYACFWFETVAPRQLLGAIPTDRILFETDFPHPTCLYGNVAERIEASLGDAPDDVREQILWGNAAELYGIEPPQPHDMA